MLCGELMLDRGELECNEILRNLKSKEKRRCRMMQTLITSSIQRSNTQLDAFIEMLQLERN